MVIHIHTLDHFSGVTMKISTCDKTRKETPPTRTITRTPPSQEMKKYTMASKTLEIRNQLPGSEEWSEDIEEVDKLTTSFL